MPLEILTIKIDVVLQNLFSSTQKDVKVNRLYVSNVTQNALIFSRIKITSREADSDLGMGFMLLECDD